MVELLTDGLRRTAPALSLAGILVCSNAAAQLDGGGRHAWTVSGAIGVPETETPFEAWPEGGHGKLRRAGSSPYVDRLVLEYRGRVTPTVDAHVVADYVDDASAGIDLTEAYFEWRPLPHGELRQQWRFGGFYPRMSLENVGPAWESPLSTSFSAVNTWLGEEIRTFGAEWLGRRKLGRAASPHEIGFYAGAFYGNDPAGTLLFWRGWALHDRQTRFGDRLPLPARPVFDSNGSVTDFVDQSLQPFSEIDGTPGIYAGLEWRLRHRALVRVSHYDNRASPFGFSSGQWSWDTAFDQIGVQIELPFRLGLVSQRLAGRTIWLVGARGDGTRSPASRVVTDDFTASYVLLTRPVGDRHRVTLRRDDFDYTREASPIGDPIDSGHAWTASYSYAFSDRLRLTAEWLEIESRRALWSSFYSLPERADEHRLLLRLDVRAGGSAGR